MSRSSSSTKTSIGPALAKPTVQAPATFVLRWKHAIELARRSPQIMSASISSCTTVRVTSGIAVSIAPDRAFLWDVGG